MSISGVYANGKFLSFSPPKKSQHYPKSLHFGPSQICSSFPILESNFIVRAASASASASSSPLGGSAAEYSGKFIYHIHYDN